MPWTPDDAKGHTSHADTDKKKRQWAHIANSALQSGHSDASAIRQANAAVHPMEKSNLTEKVADFLKANAPEIYDLYVKDMTAGDTHVPTALGNENEKKKISVAYTQDDDELAEKENKKKLQKLLDVIEPPMDLTLKITKIDAEQQKVFGWAFVSQRGEYLLVDKQGDIILPEDLEKAAHDFALHSRSHGDMHKFDAAGNPLQCGRLIVSMPFTKEMLDKAGISATDPDTGEQLYGWFVGFKVDDPALWEAHKRGERPEFSIGGRGRRVEVNV